jgi:hypothetical protein
MDVSNLGFFSVCPPYLFVVSLFGRSSTMTNPLRYSKQALPLVTFVTLKLAHHAPQPKAVPSTSTPTVELIFPGSGYVYFFPGGFYDLMISGRTLKGDHIIAKFFARSDPSAGLYPTDPRLATEVRCLSILPLACPHF